MTCIKFNHMPKDISHRNYSFLSFPMNVVLCWVRLCSVRSVSQANMQTLLNTGGRKVLPDGTTAMSARHSSFLSFLLDPTVWFPPCLLSALLSFCPSVCLNANLSILFDRPCPTSPTIITSPNTRPSSPLPLYHWSLPPWVLLRISFFQFHSTLFFHVFRGSEILGSPSSCWSTGSRRPTSRGPDRSCLLSCYLSPS